MRTINIYEYNKSLGKLIDVRNKYDYVKEMHHKDSVNIPYDELIFNHNKYLNKIDTFYITCSGGNKSKKACNILSVYGYNVVNVIK